MCFLKHFPVDSSVLKDYEHHSRLKIARISDILKVNEVGYIPDGSRIMATTVPAAFFTGIKPGTHVLSGKEILMDAVLSGALTVKYYHIPFSSVVSFIELSETQIKMIRKVTKDQIPLMLPSRGSVVKPWVSVRRAYFD